MAKVQVTLVLTYELNGEYNSDQFDSLSDQIQETIEASDLDMLGLDDGSKLTLDKVAIESAEEI